MKFHYCWKQSSIEFIFGEDSCMQDRINYGDLQSYVGYRFLVINNRHSALEYFFHYNQGLNSNNWAYFQGERSNSLKVYILGMCRLREIIWYIIHANRMLLKVWPHLTFGWPFVNISQTIHPTHSKLYIFVILMTSRVIWYTWKFIWSILKFWPLLNLCVTPTEKGPNRPKFCQNIFWPITISKLLITHFRQNGTWVLLPLQSSSVVVILFWNIAFSPKEMTILWSCLFLLLTRPFHKTRAPVQLRLPVTQKTTKSLKTLLVSHAKTFKMTKQT